MKYRLKSDHSVTIEACDVGGQETVEIPTSVFYKVFELVPGLRPRRVRITMPELGHPDKTVTYEATIEEIPDAEQSQ